MQTIKQTSEIDHVFGGEAWSLLSSVSGPLALDERYQKRVALVGNELNRSCALLVTPDGYPSQAYFAAYSTANKSGYTVDKRFVEGSVLSLLNQSDDVDDLGRDVTQEDIGRLHNLLSEAVSQGASDVMLSPSKRNPNQYLSEFDVDTMLMPYRDYTRDEVEGMMRYFYNHADQATVEEPTFKFNVSQFAAGESVLAGHRTRIRYQSKEAFPRGTDFALRLLMMSETSGFNRVEDLRVTPAQADMLVKASKKDSGAIVLAGQTSSGKTTTVKVMLENLHRNRPDIVIRSLESPPEYIIKGVHQHAVREAKGGDLQALGEHVKELMRMNPSYLFMGEVRGAESANLFLHMLDSGHGLITTSHASGVVGIYNKLDSQGVSKSVTTQYGYINALIYQRRLPRLCEHCKVPLSSLSERYHREALERLQLLQTSLERVFAAKEGGCSKCKFRGYKGTRVAMEVVRPDNRMADMIRQGDIPGFSDRWVQLCEEHGWGDAAETSLYHSLRLVVEGEVSIHTVEGRYGVLEPTMLSDDCRTWRANGGFTCEFKI